jgi:hypothetical protein
MFMLSYLLNMYADMDVYCDSCNSLPQRAYAQNDQIYGI